jgi:hypothetical protein
MAQFGLFVAASMTADLQRKRFSPPSAVMDRRYKCGIRPQLVVSPLT